MAVPISDRHACPHCRGVGALWKPVYGSVVFELDYDPLVQPPIRKVWHYCHECCGTGILEQLTREPRR